MIYQLLDRIAKAKPAAGFPDMKVGSLLSNPPPQIALYPGDLTASQASRDVSDEPRQRPWQQDIPVVQGATGYALAKNPLPASVACEAVYTDSVKPLVQTDDYAVDEKAPAIVITAAGVAKLNGATFVRVTYAFVGIYSTQEFRQVFFADVLAATLTDAERWSSLLVALTLLNQHSFVEAFNDSGTGYQSGDYASKCMLDGFTLLRTTTNIAADTVVVRLTFEAKAQMEISRESSDFSIIQRIVSPDRTNSSKSVDFAVNLL